MLSSILASRAVVQMLWPLLAPLVLAIFGSCGDVHITLLQNITTTCPGIKSDIVERNSVKFAFEMISSERAEDKVTVTDESGHTREVTFPGCYRVKMSFRVTRPIKNPYIEAFLQLGKNIPCKSPHHSSAAANICTNMTLPNSWCPQSGNEKLRKFLDGKQTCQFCHLCGALENPDVEKELGELITNEGNTQCDTFADRQNVQFKMCMPTKKEMQESHPEYQGRVEQYWQYFKEGVMTAVVHVMDREEMDAAKSKQCNTLCKTYEGKRGVSDSYKATLLRSIEKKCTPADVYAACIQHTLKFSIQGEL